MESRREILKEEFIKHQKDSMKNDKNLIELLFLTNNEHYILWLENKIIDMSKDSE